MESVQKNIFVCIAGAPNVGKSSILNAVLGEKITIVSPKPQTTRTAITGIYTRDDTQIVFTDTPGLMLPRDALGKRMVKSINSSVSGTDIVLLVCEPGEKVKPAELSIIEKLKAQKIRALLAINKIDKVKNKNELIPQIDLYSRLFPFEAVIPVSAVKNDGIEELIRFLLSLAQPGPFMYASDDLTDQPSSRIVSEFVREQILRQMQQEVPHGVAVITEKFERDEDGIFAQTVIVCERPNHKAMMIGKGGRRLRSIRLGAQKQLRGLFGVPVELEIWVRVKKDWRNSEFLINDFGLSDGEAT